MAAATHIFAEKAHFLLLLALFAAFPATSHGVSGDPLFEILGHSGSAEKGQGGKWFV
jgi:hypothetical protein